MIKLFCILFGFYLVIDALYLGSHSDHENRQCMIAKYVCAAMCGVYLIYLNARDLVIQFGIIERVNHLFISNDATQIMLLFAVTIAFFMWPDTFYRILDWLQRKHQDWYSVLVANVKIKSRRRSE